MLFFYGGLTTETGHGLTGWFGCYYWGCKCDTGATGEELKLSFVRLLDLGQHAWLNIVARKDVIIGVVLK